MTCRSSARRSREVRFRPSKILKYRTDPFANIGPTPSLISDIRPAQDFVNARSYDSAVAEYKEALDCKNDILREREAQVRIKREIEEKKKRRLEQQRKTDYWLNLNPYEFEEEVALCLKNCGFVDVANVTKKSGDDGVDIWAQKNGQKIIIQCKP